MIYHLHSFLTLWGEELCWPGLYQTYLISFLVKADGFREFKIMGREEIYSALKAMAALGRELGGGLVRGRREAWQGREWEREGWGIYNIETSTRYVTFCSFSG